MIAKQQRLRITVEQFKKKMTDEALPFLPVSVPAANMVNGEKTVSSGFSSTVFTYFLVI